MSLGLFQMLTSSGLVASLQVSAPLPGLEPAGICQGMRLNAALKLYDASPIGIGEEAQDYLTCCLSLCSNVCRALLAVRISVSCSNTPPLMKVSASCFK